MGSFTNFNLPKRLITILVLTGNLNGVWRSGKGMGFGPAIQRDVFMCFNFLMYYGIIFLLIFLKLEFRYNS